MSRIILNPRQPSPISFHIFSDTLGVKVSQRDLTPTLGLFGEYLEDTFKRFYIGCYYDVVQAQEVLEKYPSSPKYQKIKDDFKWITEVHKVLFFYGGDISIFYDSPCFYDFSYCFQTFLIKVIENHSLLIENPVKTDATQPKFVNQDLTFV